MNLPGVYTLDKNIGDIHDSDPTDISARGEPVASGEQCISGKEFEDRGEAAAADDSAVAETWDSDESEDDSPKRYGDFDRIEVEAGPGKRWGCIFPKICICKRHSAPR